VIKLKVINQNKIYLHALIGADAHINFLPASILNFVTRIFGSKTFTQSARIAKNWEGSPWQKKTDAKP